MAWDVYQTPLPMHEASRCGTKHAARIHATRKTQTPTHRAETDPILGTTTTSSDSQAISNITVQFSINTRQL